jgi:hypothetical protein
MKSINNLLTDAGMAHKRQLDEARKLTSKWENTGLLEGIGNEYERSGMAVLLENQARQLIDENSKTGTGGSQEEWSGVALPLVRRIFGEIAAKDFVSVQPMNLPSGLVFFLDFKYGSTNANRGFSAGTDIMGNTSSSGDATGGLYNGGKSGYSQNATQSLAVTFASASATWADLDYDAAVSSSSAPAAAIAGIYKFTVALSAIADEDQENVQAWRFTSGSLITEADNFPAFTRIVGSNVEFFCQVDGAGSSNELGGAATGANRYLGNVYYYKQPTATSRGDFEDSTGGAPTVANDLNIPEVNVELRSETIVAKTRKLKAVWSPEFAQDLNAYHSIDAEAELTSMLSEYVSMEIDLEILSMLSENALTKEYWSATIGEVHDGTTDAGQTDWLAGPSAAAYNQGTWFQTLGTKIQKVSNKIHAKTMRGGANFLVCGPDIATILESIPGYAADTDGNQSSFAMGVQKVGALNNRFTVYKNPYIQKDEILMGFRGTQFLETGAVYAPYVPLIMTPLVYDPQNFTPRKGVMTRYAKKVVRPEFYGKVLCKGVTTI